MTIAQQFISKDVLYQEYDFEARKKRGKIYLDKKVAKNNLLLFREIFYKNGLEFFLLYGTLLGAIREKNFIEYDSDIDVGIFERDKDKLLKIIPILLDNGFKLIRTKKPDDLVTFMKDDEYIDIGIFREEDEFYKYQNNYIKKELLEEFIYIDFLAQKFLVPKNYEKLLVSWYGKNWNIPIQNFPALADKGFKKKISYLRWKFFHSKFYLKVRPIIKSILK